MKLALPPIPDFLHVIDVTKGNTMKTITKTASGFVILIVLDLVTVAQQPAQAPVQQSAAVVANNVQLVIEGKVINVHDGDTVTVLDQNNRRFHKIYHLPGCSSYNKLAEKNQVKFDSAAEAEKAGYKLAGNCAPNKTQGYN
jgi:plastocyanin